MKDWSQHGEGRILADLFDKIPPASYTAVEFGAGDGYRFSNIRGLIDAGWTGHQWDTETWVTAENVNDLFAEAGVPEDVDLVSIDIDGNDYWVWKALTWRPQVVIIEYNALFPAGVRCALEYDPAHEWRQTADYSASITAMVELGRDKGYVLYAEVAHANLIFVRADVAGPYGTGAMLDTDVAGLPWTFWADRGGVTKDFVLV